MPLLSLCMVMILLIALCMAVFAATVATYPFNIAFGAGCVPALIVLVVWIHTFAHDLAKWLHRTKGG